MKNLKKILLAVLILALLATAVVVVALAEDGEEEEVVYNGTVAEAQKLLDAVDGMGTNAEKSAQLKEVYKYVFKAGEDSLVDPYEDGFEDLMLAYSDATLKVAQGFLKEYKDAADASAKETALKNAYSHYKNAPVYEDYESLNEDGYEEWQVFRRNYTTEAVKVLTPYLNLIRDAETLDARRLALGTVNSKFKAMYFALPNDDDATYEIPGLSDFVHEYNDWCLSIAHEYLDGVTTPAEMTYARGKWVSPDNAYNTDTEYFNKRYLPLVERMDLTIIKYANQLLDAVKVTSDNYKSGAKTALETVYTYLEKTKCIGTSRTQLADTVGVQYEALQKRVNKLSYEIAAYYYADVEKLTVGEDAEYVGALNDFIEFLSECPAIIFRPITTPDEYTGELSEAEELLLAVRGEEKEYLEAFAALYAYLSKSAPNPELEGAKEFYSEYETTKREVSDFVVSYLASLNYAPTATGSDVLDEEAFRKELKKLGEIAAFLNNTPVSSSAINKYNETAIAFAATIEKLWCRQIEYKAPVSGEAIGDLEAAKALMSAVNLGAEDALDAYVALCEYLVKTPVDTAAAGAEDFYEAFAELTKDVYALLSDKIDALATKPAYIEIFAYDCPELSYKAYEPESFEGTVKDATVLLDAARELVDSGAELSEIFVAYVAIYEYNYKTAVKPDLSGADEYNEAFETLTEDVSALIIEALAEFDAAPKTTDDDGNEVLDTEALKESAKALAAFAAFLEDAPVSADAVDAYNSVRKAFYDAINASYGADSDLERFESDLAKLIEIASYIESINANGEVLDEYNAKAAEFKVSLVALNCPVVTEKQFSAEKLDAKLEDVEALLDEVKANAKERLDAYSELYAYLASNAIAPEAEGSELFYSEYASLTASIAKEVMEKIANLNSNPYYFEAEFPKLIYSAIEPLTYGGSLADATALLNKVRYALGDDNPNVYEVMAAYAALTDYVQRNSVPKNVPGADKFYSDYENVKLSVTKLVVSAIKALPSEKPEGGYTKLEIEGELAANREILSFIRDYRVSEEAVAAYNATIENIKSYISKTIAPDRDALGDSLEDVIEIAEFIKVSPISIDVVSAYNKVLNGYTVSLKKLIDAKYSEFVDTKALLEGYLEESKEKLDALEFTALPEDVDYELFYENVASLDAYVKVKDITDYIYSAEGTSVDEFREEFAKVLNDIIAADVLEYKPTPESDVYSGNIEAAQAIIERYNAADADAKAEIYRELFNYVKKNAMNPKLNGYDGVMNSFNAMGEEVYKSFIAKIDAASDKPAAMAEMRAYLEETPISEAAVNAYNTKYLYTYNDQLNASYEAYAAVMLKLHEYIESTEGAAELVDSYEGFASAIDNYETLEILALVQFYQMKTLDEDPNAGTVSVTARGNAVKVLNNYARKYPIGEDSYAYAETMKDVSEIADAYSQLVEDARLALDDKAPLEDYNNTAFYSITDFDNGQNPLGFTHADNSTGANTGARYDVLDDTARGGMYVKFTCGARADVNPKTGATITATQQFIGKSGLPGTIPFVFEFDLTGDNGVESFPVNRLDRSGSITQMNLFRIKNNKFYMSIDGTEQPAWNDREVITPGEWTKFIFVYDPVNVTLTGYIDYELVGTWSVKTDDPSDTLVEIRIGISDGGKGLATVNLDNWNFYSGSGFRIRDKFESMTLGEEFEYFVNYMNDSTRLSTSRLQAYQKATALLEQIKLDEALLEEFKAVIEAYTTADVEKDIIAPAKAANLVKIKEYGTLLGAYEGNVTTQNYATVQLLVDELEGFISSNSEYIDKGNDAYKEVSSRISRFKSLLDRCNNVTNFVEALEKFDKAYTLAAKTKYYASAVQYYELAQFYREDIRLEFISDPAILEFEALLNAGISASDEGYVDIFTYYESCGEGIGIQKNKENSKRIIDCLDFVTSLEGYEDTEAFWEANFDYIDKYMTIIRDVVRTNSYDPTVPGVEEAIAKFRVIDVYFYAKLQEVHIAFINENLDKYAGSESYIEKLGICTYVSNYIEANDLDLTNSTVAALILKNKTYLGELEIYRSEYVTVLEQNTVKFINTVEEMKTQVSYKALSELYDKALVYYYEMNITEASQAAIEVFEAYSVTLKTMEENSAIFVGYANAISKAKNDAALFKALVNCKDYRDLASEDIEGVSAAIESYDKALSDYNAKADLINGDIAEINTVVTATRTNRIAAAIMSVINKLFNR